jgi:hypothetical protein
MVDLVQQDNSEWPRVDKAAVLAFLEKNKTLEDLCTELEITHDELLEMFYDRIDFARYQAEASTMRV